MYAKCCGYILMSASALCIHVGMSACFARPFVNQSVASARLSVRLISMHYIASGSYDCISLCSSFYLPSVQMTDIPSVRPSVCMSVCMYVHMYLCRDERTSV